MISFLRVRSPCQDADPFLKEASNVRKDRFFSAKGPLADRICRAILAEPALSHAQFGISVADARRPASSTA
jgi:hypothetical protein